MNDLTLLVLKEKVGTNIKAAKIAGPSTFSVSRFKSVRLVGFGSSDRNAREGFGVKRYGDTAIVSPDCQQPGDEKYGGHPGLEFVAGDRVDTCEGDSGGPVFWQSGNEWLLVGTTSRWTRNHSHTCGDGGVYVRTDKYTDWINSVAQRRKVTAPETAH
jgi:endonuclease G